MPITEDFFLFPTECFRITCRATERPVMRGRYDSELMNWLERIMFFFMVYSPLLLLYVLLRIFWDLIF